MDSIQLNMGIFSVFEDELDELSEIQSLVLTNTANRHAVPIFSIKFGRQIPKVLNFIGVLDEMDEELFRKHFRLSKSVLLRILEHTGNDLTRTYRGGHLPIDPRTKLLIFTWYLSNQDSQREISNLFGISEWAVHTIIHEVAKIISGLSSIFIKWPNLAEQNETSQNFRDKCRIPGIIGAVDGTHIRLINLPNGSSDYVNRKGYPSIQLQLVVNNDLLITDAYTGWPGSCHDARIMRNSPLHNDAETDGRDFGNNFIIGDSAYPLKPWLITPFRDNGHLNRHQQRFNKAFSGKLLNELMLI